MEINIKKLRELISNNESLTFERKTNYMYHGIFIPGFEDFLPVLSIIDNGILSKHKLKNIGIDMDKIYHTSNGNYFVCFSSDSNHFDRIFDIVFIVDGGPDFIKADKESNFVRFLWNTPIPLRSGLPNEYQVLGGIAPERIRGIQIRMDKLLNEIPDYIKISESEYVCRIIKAINTIYNKLEEKGLSIPIVNASDNQIIDIENFRKLR